MKYSRNIVIALIGERHFDEALVKSLRSHYELDIPEELDVFETLLFFFMFEENLTPSKFLKFFCRIGKTKELDNLKGFYQEIFNNALEKIKQIKSGNAPLFSNFRKPGWRIEYDLSPQAKRLQKEFNSDIQGNDYWIEGRKLGMNIAYLGAYIYLLGICGKEIIDLKYLDSVKLLIRFKQYQFNNGEWRNDKIVRSLVQKFASKKIFKHGKYLKDYRDYVLKVKSINPPVKPVVYHETKEDLLIHKEKKTVWKDGTPVRSGNITHDFSADRNRFEMTISRLNKQNMDIRYNGIQLPNQTQLEYNDSRLSRLLKFSCPVSRIKRKDFVNVTFGEQEAVVIEIEHLQSHYLNSCLKRKKKENTFQNALLEKTASKYRGLLYDMALDAMLQYGDKPSRKRQHFRERYHTYIKQGVTKKEINSFFYYLTEREFQIRERVKKFISYDNYLKKVFQTFFGTVLRLHNPIPMIVANNALIVPKGSETEVLYALSESYRETFGDKRLATFKASTKNSKRRYRFVTKEKMKEVTE